MDKIIILKGNIIYTDNPSCFEIIKNGYIVSCNGKIQGLYTELPQIYRNFTVNDYGDVLIIPGFYDLHNHAGQYLQCGTGMNQELLDWLNDYTYDLEKDIDDTTYASVVYNNFVNDLLRYGTLGSCIFATSSQNSTECLFEIFKRKGLRSYVGKVNMVRNAPEFIIEGVQESIDSLMYLIDKYKDEKLVKPIITPRFAPTSNEDSLEILGQLATKYNIPVQSHLSENTSEINWVKKLYKWSENYASVYDQYDLFGSTPTIMAHAVYLTDKEIDMCKKSNIYIAHCPDSNINVRSGIAPIKKYISEGIKVGLGSDIAGGHKIQMNEAIVRAIQLSKIKGFYEDTNEHLALSEAFYMATAMGGEFFGNVGKLKEGYDLDALIIEDDKLYKERYSLVDRLEKFLYIGDDRWIIDRYVAGKQIKRSDSNEIDPK